MRRRWTLEELDARLVPTYLGNQLFPLDNPWNQVVAGAPVAANSDAIIARIVDPPRRDRPAAPRRLRQPATDGDLYGIPVNVATARRPKVHDHHPAVGYADESDIVQVPIPANAVIEGDGPTGPAPPDRPRRLAPARLRPGRERPVRAVPGRPPERDRLPLRRHQADRRVGGVPDLVLGPEHELLPHHRGHVGGRGRAADPARAGPARTRRTRPSAGGVGVIDHAIRMTVQQTARTCSSSPPRTRPAATHGRRPARGWASGSG